MIKNKYHDKICYAARNNNLDSALILKMVNVLSNRDNEKVELNLNVSYVISSADDNINLVGKYYNWGLMQVPGILFFELRNSVSFVADNIIELIDPIKNLEVGCKIIRFFKLYSSDMNDVLYKYITCDYAEKPNFSNERAVKIIGEILIPIKV